MSSAARIEPAPIAKEMLAWIDLELVSCTKLQELWAGYGHVCALKARQLRTSPGTVQECSTQSNNTEQLILKIVSAPSELYDEGHLRKLLSYEVEQFFYDSIAPTLEELPLAKCLATTSNMLEKAMAAGFGSIKATLMTDLRLRYPVPGEKRAFLTTRQVYSALRWLSNFHRSYWRGTQFQRSKLILPPLAEARLRRSREHHHVQREGVWLNGGYTYLATRQTEYESLTKDENSEWSALLCQPISPLSMSIAQLAACFLTPCGRSHETYLHGDVKSENMYSTESGDDVAFFDFQYVGLGLGVCDLAKFFTCSVPLDMLVHPAQMSSQLTMSEGEKALLNLYREHLLGGANNISAPAYDWNEFQRHWETALVDWCRFQASWGFWGNTEWLQARVRSILHDQQWQAWLRKEVDMISKP
ncbi:hypothetical protein E4U60_007604 [Claviceps pazoutovae]|uniref:Aminoglycoside phosphotransferase domain-containing protein n=1 Tax=Claviceps pazoutovae TaxID=1649127 RepID=A0A9P7M3J6_9HYPO|nr:hypothetical protein E4U60_007604 [Claviceps pazoutovae]